MSLRPLVTTCYQNVALLISLPLRHIANNSLTGILPEELMLLMRLKEM